MGTGTGDPFGSGPWILDRGEGGTGGRCRAPDEMVDVAVGVLPPLLGVLGDARERSGMDMTVRSMLLLTALRYSSSEDEERSSYTVWSTSAGSFGLVETMTPERPNF